MSVGCGVVGLCDGTLLLPRWVCWMARHVKVFETLQYGWITSLK
jgi:hypothetical protein